MGRNGDFVFHRFKLKEASVLLPQNEHTRELSS